MKIRKLYLCPSKFCTKILLKFSQKIHEFEIMRQIVARPKTGQTI
jgi:hypothetical protein